METHLGFDFMALPGTPDRALEALARYELEFDGEMANSDLSFHRPRASVFDCQSQDDE